MHVQSWILPAAARRRFAARSGATARWGSMWWSANRVPYRLRRVEHFPLW